MERRTVEELVVRYELEPTLKDVYVEGPSDRAFVEWLSTEAGLDGVVAYEIDTVAIPTSALNEYELENSNRGRAIFLARALEQSSDQDLFHSVAALVDGDFDYFHDRLPNGRLLIVTDFTSVELYLFSPRSLSKLFRLVLSRADIDSDQVLEAITPFLIELFIIRAASKRLGIALSLIDATRVCTVSERTFTFDRDEYISRFIRRGSYASRHQEFAEEINRLHEAPCADRRYVIHGHDFVEIVRWYCREVLRLSRVPNLEDFHRAFRGCMELRDLEGSTLVGQLRLRFA